MMRAKEYSMNARFQARKRELLREAVVQPPGKVDNCQRGIFLGYVWEVEHEPVNERLFLPAVCARAAFASANSTDVNQLGIRSGKPFLTRRQPNAAKSDLF